MPSTFGHDADVALGDRLLDGRQDGAVPGLDDDEVRIRDADPRQLVERRGGPVVVDADALDERGRRASGADPGEVALHGLDGALHLRFDCEDRFVGHRVTSPVMSVPICSPSDGATDVPVPGHVEHHDRHLVVHRQADRGGVQRAEPVGEQIRVADLAVPGRLRVQLGVGIVHPVHPGRLQDHVRADLDRTQGGRRVGGEVRVAGPRHQDDDPAPLEMPDRAPPDVRLADLVHGDRAHHARRAARPAPGRPAARGRSSPWPASPCSRRWRDPCRAPRPPSRGRCSRRRRRSRPRTRRRAPRTPAPRCVRAISGSTPYCRSPISASPESLSRTRW